MNQKNIEWFVQGFWSDLRAGRPYDVGLLRRAVADYPLGGAGKVFLMSLDSFGLAPAFVALAEKDVKNCLRVYLTSKLMKGEK